MGLLPDLPICRLRMRRECQERFSRHCRLAIPACITAHAWRTCRNACQDRFLAVSFEVDGGENIPGACATPNYIYISSKRSMWRYGSALTMVPSRYLNQSWHIINVVYGIHMREISQEILMISICKLCFKITFSCLDYCRISQRTTSESISPTVLVQFINIFLTINSLGVWHRGIRKF